MQMNPNSVDKGFEGIKNYLVYQKMLDIDTKVISKKIAIVTKDKINSYHAPTGGMIENRLPLNTEVKAGMTIYQLLIFNKQKLIPKTIDIQAETDGIVFDLSTNNCVSQGEYVMDILEYQAN
jgi:predicted deacylase